MRREMGRYDALFQEGLIAAEVYEDPGTVFVADFLGVSNLTDAEAVSSTGRECAVRIGEFTLRAGCGDTHARGAVKIVARPERVELLPFDAHAPDNTVPGMVERTVYVGSSSSQSSS